MFLLIQIKSFDRYLKLTHRGGKISVASSDLKVGDVIYVEKGKRVPADLVLLRTSEATGSCFIRTDQLDGETDWKLRYLTSSIIMLILLLHNILKNSFSTQTCHTLHAKTKDSWN